LLTRVRLTLAIGQYAQAGLLGERRGRTLTDTVLAWRTHLADGVLPLPHPSPRNRVWLMRNRWFESELLPELREHVTTLLGDRI
jgi:uracil-DNA glycosylase